MLKAVLQADQSIPAIPSIKRLLSRIVAEEGILLDNPEYFDALVNSLTSENDWTPTAGTISFFDNCAYRIARQPVHYEDLAMETKASGSAVCLLPVCVAEQWPFVANNENIDDRKVIAGWIARLFALLIHAGQHRDVIDRLHNQIVNASRDAELERNLNKAYQTRLEEAVTQTQPKDIGRVANEFDILPLDGALNAPVVSTATFEPQAKGMESMEGLDRLNYEDFEAVVADGRLGRLCRSLSSFMEETRRLGFVTLQGVMKRTEVRRAKKGECDQLTICSCRATQKKAHCTS